MGIGGADSTSMFERLDNRNAFLMDSNLRNLALRPGADDKSASSAALPPPLLAEIISSSVAARKLIPSFSPANCSCFS
eukprot:CAMPEP_0184453404 /NCGR_PEP_ID=MMETSP0740-20130409/16526_1 /TAXON_ID=385413 /ORGANISM="Thalassiosira miniscula, Strain CCMP1093" /LENGTH=77 /DNA_ID=CAMNT_0026824621 /DNA_START=342 /DNA_END=571 /DNA_ORIENTATION=-